MCSPTALIALIVNCPSGYWFLPHWPHLLLFWLSEVVGSRPELSLPSSVGLGDGGGAYSFQSEPPDILPVRNPDLTPPLNVFLFAEQGVDQPGRAIHFLANRQVPRHGPDRPQIVHRSAHSQIGRCATQSGMQLAQFHRLDVRVHPFVGKMTMDDRLRLLH